MQQGKTHSHVQTTRPLPDQSERRLLCLGGAIPQGASGVEQPANRFANSETATKQLPGPPRAAHHGDAGWSSPPTGSPTAILPPTTAPGLPRAAHHGDAGWSSPVARQAHNLKVAGSNPAPATNTITTSPQILQVLNGGRNRRPPGSVQRTTTTAPASSSPMIVATSGFHRSGVRPNPLHGADEVDERIFDQARHDHAARNARRCP